MATENSPDTTDKNNKNKDLLDLAVERWVELALFHLSYKNLPKTKSLYKEKNQNEKRNA